MARYSPWKAAMWWNAYNAMFTLIGLTGMPLRRARYEDFTRAPLDTVRSLARWAGSLSDPADYLSDSHIRLSAGHTVAGNPMRFRTGDIAIQRDEQWRTAMTPRSQRRIRQWTFLFRLRYGYIRDRRSAAAVLRSAESNPGTPVIR